jgi:hypothetical protein
MQEMLSIHDEIAQRCSTTEMIHEGVVGDFEIFSGASPYTG